jgi:hypothetical protein
MGSRPDYLSLGTRNSLADYSGVTFQGNHHSTQYDDFQDDIGEYMLVFITIRSAYLNVG